SDAGAGTAFGGHGSIGGLSGAAIFVQFPESMHTVDPTVVGSSTTIGTDFSIQRKAFLYDGRFWAFWYDGSNIVYATSRDAVTWSVPVSTGSGSIWTPAGFDVDRRDYTVLVAFVPSAATSLRLLAGVISSSLIRWYGSYTPTSW